MKKIIVIIIYAFSLNLCSQVIYEPGYVITSKGEKLDGYIKNLEWLESPTSILYKKSLNNASQTLLINDILGFGIKEGVVYEKHQVNIDLSPKNRDRLSRIMQPEYDEQVVLLKVLLEGDFSLYNYEGQGVTRFFYKESENESLVPLVFKEYMVNDSKFATNATFKQELFRLFQCEGMGNVDYANLKYNQEELTSLFERFNKCIGAQYKIGKQTSRKYQNERKIRFRTKLGLRQNTLSATLNGPAIIKPSGQIDPGPSELVNFSKTLDFQIGFETEFTFSFNRNKWSAVFEASYFSYFDEISHTFRNDQVENIILDYSALELQVGGRHSFFLSDTSRLFINLNYVVPINIKQNIKREIEEQSINKFVTLANIAGGIGIEINNISAEFKLQGSRSLINNGNLTKYDNFAITLGYAF